MKNFLSIFNPETFKKNLSTLFVRFPLASIIVAIIFGVFVYETHFYDFDKDVDQILATLAVGLPLAIGGVLFAENRKFSRIIPQILTLIYMGLFWFFWENETIISFFGINFAGTVFFILVAPYIFTQFKKTEYYNYLIAILLNTIMSALVGGFLALFGVIALSATDFLFDLNLTFSKFQYWLYFSFLLVMPYFFISKIPLRTVNESEKYFQNRFLETIIRFIGIPFVCLYFVILYAYSFKVLLNFHEWPHGEVSWMVIAFSVVGYAIYILAEPLTQNFFVAKFRKFFPFVVIPQIFMLAYAIGLRIAQYDLTIPRYLVVLFGVWLLGISIYFIISKRKSIPVLIGSLIILLFATSFGPWSIYTLPMNRQYDRLIENFQTAKILDASGQIHKPDNIDEELGSEIYKGIRYVCKYKEKCQDLRELFAEKVFFVSEENYRTGVNIGIFLGVNYTHKSHGTVYVDPWIAYNLPEGADRLFPIDTTGYNFIYKIHGISRKKGIAFDSETRNLEINFENEVHTFSLKKFEENLKKLYPKGHFPMSEIDMTEDFEDEKIRVKVFFSQYTMKNPEYKEERGIHKYSNLQGYILIAKK